MTSAPAIGFEYRSSRWVKWLCIAITCSALCAVLASGMPGSLRVLLIAMAVAGCCRAVHRLRLPIHAVGWGSQSGWTLRGLDGGDDAAMLLSFRVLRDCVLLRLASDRYGKLTLWLVPDNSDADIRRRLRMRLAVLQTAAV